LRKKALISFSLVFIVLLTGTIGYSYIEGWSLFDAFYMTVITLSTIGYEELRPLSHVGRTFTIFLVFFGLGVVAYVINNGMKVVLEGEIQRAFGRRKLEKRLKSMKGHFIICGFGRMGKIICKELKAEGVPYVVIEKEVQVLDADEEAVFIYGDATRDELLKEAMIDRSKGLISVLSTDAQNLYVVLSARELNPDLLIVARAGEEGSEQKLLRAGADRVVSPYHIGGIRIAHTILKPAVVDFLEFAVRSEYLELQLVEIEVGVGSDLAEKTMHEAGLGRELGIIVVAVKKENGEMRFNPLHNTRIKEGDTLIAIGETGKLDVIEKLARSR
jgi:voltage-gated potassium channel